MVAGPDPRVRAARHHLVRRPGEHAGGRVADHRSRDLRPRCPGARDLLRDAAHVPLAGRQRGGGAGARIRPCKDYRRPCRGHPVDGFSRRDDQRLDESRRSRDRVAARLRSARASVTARRSRPSAMHDASSTQCSSIPKSRTPISATRFWARFCSTSRDSSRPGRRVRSSRTRSRACADRSVTRKAICGLSGGVDSSVAAVLVSRAIGDQLTCIFVDNGLLRKDEAAQVVRMVRDHFHLNLVHVDAAKRFLDALAGVTDPEQKRKTIGRVFIEVFDVRGREAGKGRLPGPRHALPRCDRERLVQGRSERCDQDTSQRGRVAGAHEDGARRALA